MEYVIKELRGLAKKQRDLGKSYIEINMPEYRKHIAIAEKFEEAISILNTENKNKS